MTPLYGHTSFESAKEVLNYPYGFKLKCKIRYWLESNGKKGFRFVSRTTNPKVAYESWNAVKPSTYMKFAGCMYLNEDGHVGWTGIGEYDDADKVLQFIRLYPGADMQRLRDWCRAKAAYCRVGSSGGIVWTINGAAQEVTQAEMDQYSDEGKMWVECCRAITQRDIEADKLLEGGV